MNTGFSRHDIPEQDIVGRCVRCGLCLPHCPTYLETLRETSSPRGRIHLIEAVGRGELSLTDKGFVGQMYQCLDCRACEAACPSGVEYGKLVEASRTQIEQALPGSPVKRGLRWLILQQLFTNLSLFRLLSALLRLYQHTGLQWLVRKLRILRLLRLEEAERLLPAMPATFLTPANQHYKAEQSSISSPEVALFAGCIMSTAFAETDRATIRLLVQAGNSVEIPVGQGCCGALTIHTGSMEQARTMAKRNIEAFERCKASAIICNAAGCGAALKEYGYLLKDDTEFAEHAQQFSTRVRDISEFLAGQPQALKTAQHPLKLKVTYQEPCHLVHAQRISKEPRQLLRAIPGIEFVEMQESALCCGSAGIYNVTQPDMAQRLQKRKIKHILETGADVVITANPGCFLQLQSGLQQANANIKVIHIVDLLDMAQKV